MVSGLARGVDQTAMAAALDAAVPVVGVPTEGIRVAARNPEIRRRALAGELCIASPYGPTMRFTAGNAMGRNKIIYALAEVTLVVCSDSGSGGTWEGARRRCRRFGRVAVWTGRAGPGNSAGRLGRAVGGSARCSRSKPWSRPPLLRHSRRCSTRPASLRTGETEAPGVPDAVSVPSPAWHPFQRE